MADPTGLGSSRELDTLRRALVLQEGFEFHAVVGPSRQSVRAVAEAALPGAEIHGATVVEGESPRQFAARWLAPLEAALGGGVEQPLVFDAWDDDPAHDEHWGWVFARLNERRNGIMRALPRPLVLLISAANERLLGRVAPDLWSVRGVGLRLPDSPVAKTQRATTPVRGPVPSSDAIAAQRHRFEDARAGSDSLRRAIEARRLAQQLADAGHAAEAFEITEPAIEAYQQSRDAQQEVAQSGLAETLELRGMLALRLGDPTLALRTWSRAAHTRAALVRRFPGSLDYQGALADLYERIGTEYQAQQDRPRAAQMLRRARSLRTEGVLPVIHRASDQSLWIPRGSLHGMAPGDRLHVLGTEGGEAVVTEVFDDSARIVASPRESADVEVPTALPAESLVAIDMYTQRCSVWVDGSSEPMEGLRQLIDVQPRLWVTPDLRAADFWIHGDGPHLSVSSSDEMLRVPRPASVEEGHAFVEHLDDVARGRILLERLAVPPSPSQPEQWAARVLVLLPREQVPRILTPGERLEVGTQFFAELEHVAPRAPPVFVNVVLHPGVSERLYLLHPSEPTGLCLLSPEEPGRGSSRVPGGGQHFMLTWPSNVPRQPHAEDIIIIASPRPLDLRTMLSKFDLRHSRTPRSAPPVDDTPPPEDTLGTPLDWEVVRVRFELVP